MMVKTRYRPIGDERYEVIIVDIRGEENIIGQVFKEFGHTKWKFKSFFKLNSKQKILLHENFYNFIEAGRILVKLWEKSLFFNFFDGDIT